MIEDRFAALVEAVARGDQEAFGRLYDYFAPRIHAFLRRSGVETGVAEELTQEVMTKLWRRARQFDRRKASVATWVYAISRHMRVDHFRQQRGEPPLGELAFSIPDAADGPDEMLIRAQLEESVRRALQDLPQEQLAIMTLAFVYGLSHAEIAARTGLPVGTVKGRIRLALARLRRSLK